MIIKWVGGKTKIAPWICSNIPRSDIFVDVFGGSGSVLDLAISQSKAKRYVYNDLDTQVYTFFKVLQSQGHELSEKVFLTPYSRQCFEESHEILHDKQRFKQLSSLQQALCFFIVNRQSFGSKMESTWSITRDGEINYETWQTLPNYILRTFRKFKNVFLENLDYRKLVPKWDSERTIFYFDPPYENVEDKYYSVNRSSGFDHANLLECAKNIKGSFLTSYYGSSDGSDDSELVKKYIDIGCDLKRRKVHKHLSSSRQKVTEILAVRISEHKFRHGELDDL